jgi:phosphoribosylformylglycinamidine synthase subunit PurSL
MTAPPAVEPQAMDQVDRTDPAVFRVEVWPKPGEPDPHGLALLGQAKRQLGNVSAVHTARVYLIQAPLSDEQAQAVARELLTDPVTQLTTPGAKHIDDRHTMLEVHYQPGVMDPVAQSAKSAICEMFPDLPRDAVEVRTGFRYDFDHSGGDAGGDSGGDRPGEDALRRFAEGTLANPVIQDIHLQPFSPDEFPHGHAYELRITHVPIRELDDDALMKLSRDGHLFLSLAEMHAVRDHYREIGRDPTDIELETFAQTWSEHCVHKTLKSAIRYREGSGIGDQGSGLRFEGRPGHTVHNDGSVTIDNLLKRTVAAATFELMATQPHKGWCVSVFEDNSGIVRFDDEDGICIKVETHNHPSAIEPYGGAATGIGGCVRDIIGTGLAARPIANMDTFCVAHPGVKDVPPGVIPPKRTLQQVVAGVRDYGNRMGIPTVNGAVYFDNDYVANPLIFAGCVGLIPLDRCFGKANPGDRIVALGGATGRDGIHGATFSSAELTDTHADEFSHAVQIGNAITEKQTLDVILQARDQHDGPLYSGLTDCGAGGFSSAIGELGEKVGAYVTLENAPLKYQGLSYTEIWISEAQERMVLSVPPDKLERLKVICEAEGVELSDMGHFGELAHGSDEPQLVLTYQGTDVGHLPMPMLHKGIPTPTREAIWPPTPPNAAPDRSEDAGLLHTAPIRVGGDAALNNPSPPIPDTRHPIPDTLLRLLAHPNIASKHWIVRQYDHEVQAGSVVKPLTGPEQDGPSDAAVIRPKLDSRRGIALSVGGAPYLSEKTTERGHASDGDSYYATLAAIDEAVRNAVCVGADPSRIAILDNFCWPNCDDPSMLGTLVRAAEACYDGAKAYKTPFVSGKDSLSNQFTTKDGKLITIPQTLLISAVGIVKDTRKARTMDAKAAGNLLIIVGDTTANLGGSHYAQLGGADAGNRHIPRVDLKQGPSNANAVASLIDQGLVRSAHDCSEGGLLIAAAEMAFAGRIGLDLDLAALPTATPLDAPAACFAETPSRYLLEIQPDKLDPVIKSLRRADTPFGQVGTFTDHDRLTLRTPRDGRILDARLDDLRYAWLGTLDW